ncbi:hypothetical protein [Clostridium beijerinckii]|nr:hypothetical protein [Clostridium beijerinckii]
MIQAKRETSKENVKKPLEQIVEDQAQQISDLKQVIDDMILNNGGAV